MLTTSCSPKSRPNMRKGVSLSFRRRISTQEFLFSGTSEQSPPVVIQALLTSFVAYCSHRHRFPLHFHLSCSTSTSMGSPSEKCMSMAAPSVRLFLFRHV